MSHPTLGFAPLSEGYEAVYASLSELRETFHRSGRLDDSNAKLDEVAKLFASYLAFKREQVPSFPLASNARIIPELQECFAVVASLPQYVLNSGDSIFGTRPVLALREGDEALARELVGVVRQAIDSAFQNQAAGRPFDVLNEAFGHFVRDNFRGNIEDAQYMTPPEVVDFMTEVAVGNLNDFGPHSTFTVVDPSCGVGSFLAAFYHRVRTKGPIEPHNLRLVGQDKVERMARLAKINLELFDVKEYQITIGNSLTIGANLDRLNGTVDLVLTNPPFGARFEGTDVRASFGANTPFFSGLRTPPNTIDSELLFIDRNLRLLREGGQMLIVVPDGVVSAKGTAALLRQYVGGTATVRAVVELPAVTFAQAGTRTKTAVLHLEKGRHPGRHQVFMAIAKDLGFQVSSRKGVQVKQAGGSNDLPSILQAMAAGKKQHTSGKPRVLSITPSCVQLDETDVLREGWTPNHHSASRLEAIHRLNHSGDLVMTPLRELADFVSESRRAERWTQGKAFLSVLHVIGEGLIDLGAVHNYSPKTPGIPVFEGEILFSKINPRIPRVCVTPNFGMPTLCSSEFAVLKPNGTLKPYLLAYLLLSNVVQTQVRSLTSGTSASHNRVRSSELGTVLIPVPRAGSVKATHLADLASQYANSMKALSLAQTEVASLRFLESELLPPSSSPESNADLISLTN